MNNFEVDRTQGSCLPFILSFLTPRLSVKNLPTGVIGGSCLIPLQIALHPLGLLEPSNCGMWTRCVKDDNVQFTRILQISLLKQVLVLLLSCLALLSSMRGVTLTEPIR